MYYRIWQDVLYFLDHRSNKVELMPISEKEVHRMDVEQVEFLWYFRMYNRLQLACEN